MSGTPAQPGTWNFSVTSTDANGCSGAQAYTLVVDCALIGITPSTVPNGVVGLPYSQTLAATGGTAPYTFSVAAGSLPVGLSLSPSGTLSGVPAFPGSSSFTVEVLDAFGCLGYQGYLLTVDCPLVSLQPPSLPSGTVGQAYNEAVTASGGTGPYTFAVIAGNLPTGLGLSPSGTISGTPTTPEVASFTVEATDSTTCTGSLPYTITIDCNVLALTPVDLPKAQQGQFYFQILDGVDGVAPTLSLGRGVPSRLRSHSIPAGPSQGRRSPQAGGASMSRLRIAVAAPGFVDTCWGSTGSATRTHRIGSYTLGSPAPWEPTPSSMVVSGLATRW